MMTELVNIRDHVEDVIIDLRYGTENNFTGQVIYDFSDALLRKGTALRLRRASLYLSELGYRLKIWDAYRPVSAQLRLWEVYPDPRFVADPINGHSNHSRGSAVDLTLTDKDGNELLMPTGFDDFSSRAGRTYEGISDEARRNCVLEKLQGVEESKRKARFVCCICYIDENGNKKYAEGYWNGKIAKEAKGDNGFGYDPIFIPDGENITSAQMPSEEKNKKSHRAKALKKLREILS